MLPQSLLNMAAAGEYSKSIIPSTVCIGRAGKSRLSAGDCEGTVGGDERPSGECDESGDARWVVLNWLVV